MSVVRKMHFVNIFTGKLLNGVAIITNNQQTGITRYSKMRLTEFGKLFVAACTPPEGFERFAKK